MSRLTLRTLALTLSGWAAVSGSATAAQVISEADVLIGGVMSDNLTQAEPGEEQADLNLRLEPALRLYSQAGRLEWSLDMSAAAEGFASDSGANRIDPTVNGSFTAELLADRWFLEGGLSLRQSFIDQRARGPGGEGASLSEERNGVFSAFFNPRWRSDFSGFAQFLGSYQVEFVSADEVFSGRYNHLVDLALLSDREFSNLDWQLRYLGEWNEQSGESDPSENHELRAELDYAWRDDWTLSAVIGYANGEGQDTRGGEIQAGSYWSLGGRWTPGRRFSTRVLLGPDNQEYALRFTPTRRTDLEISMVKRSVGRDAGRIWAALVRHRSRYGIWLLRYEESNTSQSQSEVLDFIENPAFEVVDEVLDPGATLGISDERYFQQRLLASVDYERPRTLISLRGAYERREYFSDGDDTWTWEAGLDWRWRVGRRTSTVLELAYEDVQLRDGDGQRFFSLGTGVNYQLTETAQGFLGFSHLRVDAEDNEQEFRENRFGLLLQMEF